MHLYCKSCSLSLTFIPDEVADYIVAMGKTWKRTDNPQNTKANTDWIMLQSSHSIANLDKRSPRAIRMIYILRSSSPIQVPNTQGW